MEELRPLFFGRFGVRSGWRLLAYGGTWLFLAIALMVTVVVLGYRPPKTSTHFESTPGAVMLADYGMAALCVCSAAVVWLACRRDRPWRQVGLPVSKDARNIFPGLLIGFGALAILVGMMALSHSLTLSFSPDKPVLLYGGLWFLAQLGVGFGEETFNRGYFQATLSDGIGFWWAALVTSAIFGSMHAANPGENWFGMVSCGLMGLVFCFAIRRSGSLWLGIGIHCGWNWAETFFFGTPNSGTVAAGHLFSATAHGNPWVSGGAVGPEGSLFVVVAMALIALAIHKLYPQNAFLTAAETPVASKPPVLPSE